MAPDRQLVDYEFTARTAIDVDVHFGAVGRVNSGAPVTVLRLSVIGGQEVDPVGDGVAVLDLQSCNPRM